MALKRHRPCGKNRYATHREGIRAAMISSRRSGLALRVYRCPKCHGWHLTSKPNLAERAPVLVDSGGSTPAAKESSGGCSCGQCSWL